MHRLLGSYTRGQLQSIYMSIKWDKHILLIDQHNHRNCDHVDLGINITSQDKTRGYYVFKKIMVLRKCHNLLRLIVPAHKVYLLAFSSDECKGYNRKLSNL